MSAWQPMLFSDSAAHAANVIEEPDVFELSQKATHAIYKLFEQSKVVAVAFSGGKDSSVLLHLTYKAALKAKAEGLSPFLVVTSSDTGVENPVIALQLRAELKKLARALKCAGVRYKIIVTKPSLATSWQVRILGGTKLPSFPGQSSDCSIAYKVAPQQRVRAQLFKQLGQDAFVTLVGTRFAESASRQSAMIERGETDSTPYRNKGGELMMSPLAYWSTDAIWELIGYIRSDLVPSYSSMEEVVQLYSDAGATSCAVVNDAISEGTKNARGGCGARFGCYVCQAVANDTSLQSMIESDEKYAYMRGLNDLRDLIAHYRWDYTKRYWVLRTINETGHVRLTPDCYSPAFVLELFRYAASLDAQEIYESQKLGIKPRFEILSIEQVVAIDAIWSLNGFHKPHTALLEWLDIVDGKRFYPAPKAKTLPAVKRMRVNHVSEVHAGQSWDGASMSAFSGMRDVDQSLSACMAVREHHDGRLLPDLETGAEMSVDIESISLALEFEMDAIVKRHNCDQSDWTSGYRFWVSYGTLSLSATQLMEHDNMLRRTAWRANNGFLGEKGNSRAQEMALAFEMTS